MRRMTHGRRLRKQWNSWRGRSFPGLRLPKQPTGQPGPESAHIPISSGPPPHPISVSTIDASRLLSTTAISWLCLRRATGCGLAGKGPWPVHKVMVALKPESANSTEVLGEKGGENGKLEAGKGNWQLEKEITNYERRKGREGRRRRVGRAYVELGGMYADDKSWV